MSEGRFRRAYLGIAGGTRPLPPRLARELGRKAGVEIVEVVTGIACRGGGLRPEDLIVAVDDKPVDEVDDVQRLMVGDRIGAKVVLDVLREGRPRRSCASCPPSWRSRRSRLRSRKRADRVLRLVAEHRERQPVACVADRLVPGDVAPPVQLLLRVAHGLRELRRELVDELVDLGVELGRGDRAVDEPPLGRLRRRDLLAEEEDLARTAVADHDRQPLRRATRRHRAVLGPDVADERVVGHHREVARHLQLVAAADRDALHARDRRLADLAQPVVHVLERAEPLPVLAGVAESSAPHAFRSAPTQNARPVPVTTTTRISSSQVASSHARASSRSIRKSNAFSTSGRFSGSSPAAAPSCRRSARRRGRRERPAAERRAHRPASASVPGRSAYSTSALTVLPFRRSKEPERMPGKLVHFELPSRDTNRAKTFWSGVFGWSFSDSGMPGMEYWMMRTGEDQGGADLPVGRAGAAARSSTSTPTTSTPRSPRCASSAARREDKSPIPHVGWFAHCTDTEGNAFSLFQSDESVAG